MHKRGLKIEYGNEHVFYHLLVSRQSMHANISEDGTVKATQEMQITHGLRDKLERIAETDGEVTRSLIDTLTNERRKDFFGAQMHHLPGLLKYENGIRVRLTGDVPDVSPMTALCKVSFIYRLRIWQLQCNTI